MQPGRLVGKDEIMSSQTLKITLMASASDPIVTELKTDEADDQILRAENNVSEQMASEQDEGSPVSAERNEDFNFATQKGQMEDQDLSNFDKQEEPTEQQVEDGKDKNGGESDEDSLVTEQISYD